MRRSVFWVMVAAVVALAAISVLPGCTVVWRPHGGSVAALAWSRVPGGSGAERLVLGRHEARVEPVGRVWCYKVFRVGDPTPLEQRCGLSKSEAKSLAERSLRSRSPLDQPAVPE